MAGLWCSSRARARSCGVSRREAHGRLRHKPPQLRGGMWLGMWDVPRGTGSFSSCSMIVLTIPRRLPWPNRAGSTRYVHNNSIQPFVRTRSRRHQWKGASRWCSDSGRCQQTPVAAAVTRVIVPWHLHGRVWSMIGQIGHRELVGAIAGTFDESAPQRASTARKCNYFLNMFYLYSLEKNEWFWFVTHAGYYRRETLFNESISI